MEPYNNIINIHKRKFKGILTADPYNFCDIILLYKKLLFIHACQGVLNATNARFYPVHSEEDCFKSIIYTSQMPTLISNGRYPFEISFRHKFTFSKDVDRTEVEATVRFHIYGAPHQDDNKFSRTDEIKLYPFDMKRIAKDVENLIKKMKCTAFYEFEKKKHIRSAKLPPDTYSPDRPVSKIPKINQEYEQKFEVRDDEIYIIVKPSYLVVENYSNYFNKNYGTKLWFALGPQNIKISERYERTKLITRYANTIDSLKQIIKDLERLDSFVDNNPAREDMSNSLSEKFITKIVDLDCRVEEYHSTSLYTFNDKISLRFVYDKVTDVMPHRFQYLRHFHEEKDSLATKMIFLKEIKQCLGLLELSIELSDKKDQWLCSLKEKNINYFIDILPLDPWHFIIMWRSIFDENLLSFFFYFQILSGDQVESFRLVHERCFVHEKSKYEEKQITQLLEMMENWKGTKGRLHTSEDFKKFIGGMTRYLTRVSSNYFARHPHHAMNRPSVDHNGI